MKDVIVIKIGGVAAQKLSDKFIKQMQEWIAAGKKIVVVHGGGQVLIGDNLLTGTLIAEG